jgi:hypothetical protein
MRSTQSASRCRLQRHNRLRDHTEMTTSLSQQGCFPWWTPLWYLATFGGVFVIVAAWSYAWHARRFRHVDSPLQQRIIAVATLVILSAGFINVILRLSNFLRVVGEHHLEWKVDLVSLLFTVLADFCHLIALSIGATTIGGLAYITLPRGIMHPREVKSE